MAKQVAVALLSGDALNKLIGQIGRASAKLVNMIQDAAVQCVAQSIVHRNATPAMQLFDAVGSGTRRDALVAYFEKYGNLTWSKAEKKVIFCDMAKIPNGRELKWDDEYATEVMQSMWLKAAPEREPKSVFDVDEEAQKFIDRLRKAGKKGATLKNSELLDRLVETYNKYVGEQYAKSTVALPTESEVKDAAQNGGVDPKKLQDLQEKFGGRPTEVKQPIAA